jgi:hypothetical protein
LLLKFIHLQFYTLTIPYLLTVFKIPLQLYNFSMTFVTTKYIFHIRLYTFFFALFLLNLCLKLFFRSISNKETCVSNFFFSLLYVGLFIQTFELPDSFRISGTWDSLITPLPVICFFSFNVRLGQGLAYSLDLISSKFSYSPFYLLGQYKRTRACI